MKHTILSLLLVVGCMGRLSAIDFKNTVGSDECNRWVDSVFNTLDERGRVAQLFVPVVDPKQGEAARTLIRRYVKENGVGGLLFRGGSIQQYVNLTNYAQSLSRVPLMMTLDGEWGIAMRVPEAPKYPYNMALGAITDYRLLEEYGAQVAVEMKKMGLHVDFAPVADVNTNPENPVIGRRSFGENPQRVASAVVAFSRGMEREGVISCAKHFPGHGDTSTDSHKALPVVEHGRERLDVMELKPFKQYIDAGLSSIMVGHLSVPALDPSGTPASMSRAISTELLQDELGFKGLVFTDALEMKGANVTGNHALEAFKAGAGALLSSGNPPADIDVLLNAARSGEVPMDEVNRRCRLMLAYKWACGLCQKPERIEPAGIAARLDTQSSRSLKERLTAATATAIAPEGVFPLPLDKGVAIVSLGASADNEFASTARLHAPATLYSSNGGSLTAAQLEKVKDADLRVIAVFDDKAGTVSEATRIAREPSTVLVFFINPYKAVKFKDAIKASDGFLMMYDDNVQARRAAADALYGTTPVTGHLPVTMPGIAKEGEGVSYGVNALVFSQPTDEMFAPWLLDSISDVTREGVKRGAFTGIQVLVAHGNRVIVNHQRGRLSHQAGAAEVDGQSVFDMASMTKCIGTLPGIMTLCDRGLTSVDDTLGALIPELNGTDKSRLTLRQLLYHQSGMPAALNMYDVMIDPESYEGPLTKRRAVSPYTIRLGRRTYANAHARLRRDITAPVRSDSFPIEAAKGIWVGNETRDTIMNRIYGTPLRDDCYRYSCLNFCLLVDAEQHVTGARHEDWVSDNVFKPIGAYSLCYNPGKGNVVSTEKDPFLRKQLLTGYVHDEMAAFAGGVMGNAGLFGNAADVAKICLLWLQGGSYGGKRIWSKELTRRFTSDKSASCRRGLGFDKPDVDNPDSSPCVEEVPASTYGHTGYTGTCFWIDPDNEVTYIFLSNRVCPSRENSAWVDVKARSRIHSLIYKALREGREGGVS